MIGQVVVRVLLGTGILGMLIGAGFAVLDARFDQTASVGMLVMGVLGFLSGVGYSALLSAPLGSAQRSD